MVIVSLCVSEGRVNWAKKLCVPGLAMQPFT